MDWINVGVNFKQIEDKKNVENIFTEINTVIDNFENNLISE